MICADTSVWIAFIQGEENRETEILSLNIEQGRLLLSPPILMELLSSPELTNEERQLFLSLPMLDIVEGLWTRAGDLRRKLLKQNLKAHSMDCLIAQICIDNHTPLLAVDGDFRHFTKMGLKILG